MEITADISQLVSCFFIAQQMIEIHLQFPGTVFKQIKLALVPVYKIIPSVIVRYNLIVNVTRSYQQERSNQIFP